MAKVFRVISEDRYNYLMSKLTAPTEPVQQGRGATDFIDYLPQNLQQRARALLSILKQLPNFRVEHDGSVVINDHHIIGSRITDLLTFATQSGYQRKIPYAGQQEFIQLVKHANVPLHLLSTHFIERLHGYSGDSKWIKTKLTGP